MGKKGNRQKTIVRENTARSTPAGRSGHKFRPLRLTWSKFVGMTGFEPVTPTV